MQFLPGNPGNRREMSTFQFILWTCITLIPRADKDERKLRTNISQEYRNRHRTPSPSVNYHYSLPISYSTPLCKECKLCISFGISPRGAVSLHLIQKWEQIVRSVLPYRWALQRRLTHAHNQFVHMNVPVASPSFHIFRLHQSYFVRHCKTFRSKQEQAQIQFTN